MLNESSYRDEPVPSENPHIILSGIAELDSLIRSRKEDREKLLDLYYQRMKEIESHFNEVMGNADEAAIASKGYAVVDKHSVERLDRG